MSASNDVDVTTQDGLIRNAKTDAKLLVLADLMFVAVPFIFTAGVFLYFNKLQRFWGISEWAFAAAILSGQAMIKLISGLVEGRIRMRPARIGLLMSSMLVLGVFPSIILLMFNMVLMEDPKNGEHSLPVGLTVLQIVWFTIAVTLYLSLGGLGEYARMRKEIRTKAGSHS